MARVRAGFARCRRAFTLVELLVVMTLIVLIASITALVLPGILRSQKAGRGASMLQGMLLTAKQRALRDQRPAGVRLLIRNDDVNTTTNVSTSTSKVRLVSTEMVYIVQPEDFVVTGDSMTLDTSNHATSVTTDFAGGLSTLLPAVPDQFPVQGGDFLELNGGGQVAGITNVGADTLGMGGTALYPGFHQLTLYSNPSTGQPVGSYRIIRGPRHVVGEDSVKMPQDVGVMIKDFNTDPVNGTVITNYSLNIPQRPVPFGSTFYLYEILFSPSGGVTGQGVTTTDKIVLFVADLTRDNPTTDGEPALVTVNISTGAIAVQPVDVSSGNAYTFTQDPRASGM